MRYLSPGAAAVWTAEERAVGGDGEQVLGQARGFWASATRPLLTEGIFTGCQVRPASTERNSPPGAAANTRRGFRASTSTAAASVGVGHRPTWRHPQKQSMLM